MPLAAVTGSAELDDLCPYGTSALYFDTHAHMHTHTHNPVLPLSHTQAKPPQFESVHRLLQSSSWKDKQEAQRHAARVHAVQKKTRILEHMFGIARANEQVTAR